MLKLILTGIFQFDDIDIRIQLHFCGVLLAFNLALEQFKLIIKRVLLAVNLRAGKGFALCLIHRPLNRCRA